MLIMHQLASVLFDMDAFDADPFRVSDTRLGIGIDGQRDLANDRMV